ncbi:GNAT family N-acetyltransferase [Robertmurraya massiliosenegalensis]|uniref:GNAT family N-acetyltransferase n=1 Tax=Robertmurraya TaxID=2837507 RepID=UPI0039A6789B
MKNMKPEDIIQNKFGIPIIDGISTENLTLITNAKFITRTTEKDFHCRDNDYKFCLVHENGGFSEPIFIMDFFLRKNDRLMQLMKEEPYIKLELLYVVKDTLRRQGIATFYIKKLIKYAKEENITCIKVVPNPEATNFEKDSKINALDLEQLVAFYKKFENNDIRIKLIETGV